MRLETSIAKLSLDVTARRDPVQVYHKMTLVQFEGLADSFNWSLYFATINTPPMQSLNVAVPDFFKGEENLLKTVPMADWISYLTVHTEQTAAPMLPTRFEDENFAFYGKYLRGEKEQKARWKRCVAAADADLGRGARQSVCRADVRPGGKAAHARYGAQDRRRDVPGSQCS